VNKVLVDWSQNDDHKTTICVYSLRAKDYPTVSTPITWKEVEQCLKKKDPELLVFKSDDTLKRVQKMDDIFADVLTLKQRLPKLNQMSPELLEQFSRYASKLKPSLRSKATRSVKEK
jgi:bifunctional non-homologous end joining protein LigD